MNLKITRMNVLDRTDSLRAFVDVEYEGLQINGCRIVDGRSGRFISMPRELAKDGKYYDIVRFGDVVLKQEFERAILDVYDKLEKGKSNAIGEVE